MKTIKKLSNKAVKNTKTIKGGTDTNTPSARKRWRVRTIQR